MKEAEGIGLKHRLKPHFSVISIGGLKQFKLGQAMTVKTNRSQKH